MNQSLEIIGQNYLRGAFLIDLITFLPLGLLSVIDERLKFLWLLKDIRLKLLYKYFNKTFFKPFINYYIEQKQVRAFNDEKLKNDINQDNIFIQKKIVLMNIY